MKKSILSVKTMFIFAIVAAAALTALAGKYKEIYFSEPKYMKRSTEQWANQSRVVGELNNAPPEFVMEIQSHPSKSVAWKRSFKDILTVYESGWLPPGTYTMEIKSEGFDKSFLKAFKLQAGSDCLVNLEFGKIAYERNY